MPLQRGVNRRIIRAGYPFEQFHRRLKEMRSIRSVIYRMFGYSIERLDEYNDAGLPTSVRYEARCPYTDHVITSSPTLKAARQCVIARELSASNDALHDDRHVA
jgi:hypothetical protein